MRMRIYGKLKRFMNILLILMDNTVLMNMLKVKMNKTMKLSVPYATKDMKLLMENVLKNVTNFVKVAN